jgi:hypothetical protein
VKALASRLLLERGGAPMDGPERRSRVMESCELYPAEALGNANVRARRVVRALFRGRLGALVSRPDGWGPWGAGRRRRFEGEDEILLGPPWCDALFARTREREAHGGKAFPETREEFSRLVEEAFGPAHETIPTTDGDDAAEVRELGEALWERVQLFREQAATESDGFRRLRSGYTSSLDYHITSLDADGKQILRCAPTAQAMARELMDVLEPGEAIFDRAIQLNHRCRRACWALLVKRYGVRPEFEEFMPPEPEPGSVIVMAKILSSTGREEEAWAILKEYEDYREMKKVMRGGAELQARASLRAREGQFPEVKAGPSLRSG